MACKSAHVVHVYGELVIQKLAQRVDKCKRVDDQVESKVDAEYGTFKSGTREYNKSDRVSCQTNKPNHRVENDKYTLYRRIHRGTCNEHLNSDTLCSYDMCLFENLLNYFRLLDYKILNIMIIFFNRYEYELLPDSRG